jgi:hypothetical protein
MNLGCQLKVLVSGVIIRIPFGPIHGVFETKEEWEIRFYDNPIPLLNDAVKNK